jgi:type II secretory pathway component PulF
MLGRLAPGLETDVAGGRTLSEALARFPDEVPADDVALLEAGEATGNLDRTLERLADRHEARRAARRRFLTESAYPLLLFHLAALLTPLPAAVARDGTVFGPTWLKTMLSILVPFYAIVLAVAWLNRTARGRAIVGRAVDLLPGFGNAARHRRCAEFAEVLGAAYEAGITLDKGLAMAGRATRDPRVDAAVAAVGRGETLRDALARASVLPPPLVVRLAVAEQAGDISKALQEIARNEAEIAENVHRRSAQLAAKGLYIAVALWIAIYYVSTFLGIYGGLL